MGFPCAGIRMPKPIAITALLNLLRHIKFMSVVALSHLGLFNPVEQDYSASHPASHVLAMDRSSPSLLPEPIHISTATIKTRLPVVSYHDYLERYKTQVDEGTTCAVCLDGLEWSHEIRELSNCSHVFHRECLDSWVDEIQVTCPLCRSLLLPAKGDIKRCEDPQMMERSVYLFGEDMQWN